MARVCPLYSSSSGNSTYIKEGNSGILVDAGASYKSIKEAILSAGGEVSEIKAVLVTHEHIDHVKGLKTLLKKTGATLYASSKTLETLDKKELIPAETEACELVGTMSVGDFGIKRFDTSHDCVGSSGYNVFLKDGRKVTICTDLGVVTDTVRDHILGSDALLFESNHDVEMLRRGPYPPELKLRILSDKGHLSNVACSSELKGLLESGTTRFILGHISQHNNLPMLVKTTAKTALSCAGAVENEDYFLTVAKPSNNGVISL